MNSRTHSHRLVISALLLTLAACGGGGDGGAPVPPPAPSPPPPPPGTVIGAAGGTVTGASGASVVIPAGALATNTTINIAPSSAAAPALPAGSTANGQSFAFTPHGTTFAVPVTMTLPFNPASVPAGTAPAFYKTNAQNQWERIANATFGATSVSAQVTSFSDATVATEPFTVGDVGRQWTFNVLHGIAAQVSFLQGDTVSGGRLSEFRDFGSANYDAEFALIDGRIIPPDERANGAIGASEDGTTFNVAAEAMLQSANIAGVPLGSESILVQVHTFTKRNDNASLTLTMPKAVIDAHDENAALHRVCPDGRSLGDKCILIEGSVSLDIDAFTAEPSPGSSADPADYPFFHMSGGALVVGFAEHWTFELFHNSPSKIPLWAEGDFQFVVRDFNNTVGSHALLTLVRSPIHPVDLSSIEVGQTFHVRVTAKASTFNMIAGPPSEFMTSVGAYLREALKVGGAVVEFSGLDVIDTPIPLPEPPPADQIFVLPASCSGGANPAAGAIQFGSTNYSILENGTPPTITVIRTGGTVGAVTATFTTSDGTAIAPADYTAVNTTVFFADGDAAPRVVRVPIVQNTIGGEPDKTVNLTLSQPGNCATLGTQTTALLTIRDDDPPPPTPAFTIGGTVTGLVGTGLQLQDLQFVPITPGNGPFTFTLPTQTGSPYAVTVVAQPINPVQICSVLNGTGTVTNANITNVVVNCVTPTVSGALDPTFGGTGKVSIAFGGDETAMVLQSDGKIIMVGGSGGTGSDFALARFDTDGTLDETFGSLHTGMVTTDISGGADDALGVALQSDGKIIVVGTARVGGNDDFAVVRYDTSGVVDTTFGTLGKVTTDFAFARDRAFGVAIQANDSIVVVGDAIMPAPGNTDFAVARYTANGAPDTTFDGDGKLNTDIGGGVDIAHNVLLQGSQGAILVSGVLTLGGSPVLGHGGLVRYNANGTLDTSFATGGKRTVANVALGEALALQGDGKILIAGSATVGGRSQFGLMRLDANGGTDGTFGSAGLATAGFSTQSDFGRAIALRPDGRILVAGQSSNLSNPDFAVACFDSAGALDGSFDADGKLTIDFFGSFDGAENVAVQTDGKIVISGFARNVNRTVYALARIEP